MSVAQRLHALLAQPHVLVAAFGVLVACTPGGSPIVPADQAGPSDSDTASDVDAGADTCSGDCALAVCGNGVLEADEECDGTVTAHGACDNCRLTCELGWGNCAAVNNDGCETQLNVDGNCGRCGRSCLGAACVGSACEPAGVTMGGGATDFFVYRHGIAVDNVDVYWTTTDRVLRTAKDGTGSLVEVAAAEAGPGDLVVTDDRVFWLAIGTAGGNYEDGAVRTRPKDFSTPATDVVAPLALPRNIAVSPTHLYWTTCGTSGAAYSDGAVWAWPLTGATAAQSVWPNFTCPVSPTVVGSQLLWITRGSFGAGYTDGRVWQASADGSGQASPLAENETELWKVTADTADAFWISWGSGTVGHTNGYVRKRILTAASPVQSLADSQVGPVSVAVDETYVYWAACFGFEVLRTLKDGSQASPEVLAYVGGAPIAIALDNVAAYVLLSDGTVLRIAK